MLNLLIRTKPWMIAYLIAATSVFGQNTNNNSKPQNQRPTAPSTKACPKPCVQPCPPTQICPSEPKACCPPWSTPVLNAAYNYPARTQTRCPWDMFTEISFIYWQPVQENMELGIANAKTSTNLPVLPINGNFINMDFNFKPGFKIGLGGYFEHDNWDLHLEYTWFHSTSHKGAAAQDGGRILDTQVLPQTTYGAWFTASQNWNLKMDILQLDLGRWQYTGTKLTSHPYVGVRGALIRQNLHTSYAKDAGKYADASQQTKSWAIGPEMGIDNNWMFSHGFRVFANAEADVTFTRYTKATFTENETGGPSYIRQRNINSLRTHLDFELGFGWGTYFDCNNWYMDFALAYGFQAFFDQNMFRNYADSYAVAVSFLPNGNLYINGLTATFSLTF